MTDEYGMEQYQERNRKRLTVVLMCTLCRPALGAFTFWALYAGEFAIGFAIYVFGQVTDVADGFLARRWGLACFYGAQTDRLCDILLQLLGFAGFIAGAIFGWGTWETSWPYIVAIAAPALLLTATMGWLIKSGTDGAKIRAGVFRVLLLAGVVATGAVPIIWIVVGSLVLSAIGLYELNHMRRKKNSVNLVGGNP